MKPYNAILTAALMLAASTAGVCAQTESASNAVHGNASKTTTTPAPADSALRSEVEQLKALLREQQQRIDALEQGSNAARKTPAPPAVVASTAPVAAALEKTEDSASSPPNNNSGQNVSQAQTVQAGSSDERIRSLERQIKGLGPISFSGDIRLRAEPSLGGPATNHSNVSGLASALDSMSLLAWARNSGPVSLWPAATSTIPRRQMRP